MYNPRPKILLAEDDRDLRELLAFCLFRAGYSVTCCNNGLDLLERMESHSDHCGERFDLVLTDLRMLALTGLEVLEALHDHPERPPFVCMTAFGDPETHEEARRLGAAFTIDKPVDVDHLIALVDSICPVSKTRQTDKEMAK
jgi:CheY-like chemotaxis protein